MTNKNHPPKKTVKIISLKNDHDKKKKKKLNWTKKSTYVSWAIDYEKNP